MESLRTAIAVYKDKEITFAKKFRLPWYLVGYFEKCIFVFGALSLIFFIARVVITGRVW